MGLTVDFLDMGISYEVDRMDDRPKNSNQPNPAKADLLSSEVSRAKASFRTEYGGSQTGSSHSMSKRLLSTGIHEVRLHSSA
jgi:hypothetical protein